MRNFSGTTTRDFVAALNGCPDFKSRNASNLNTDCDVRTEPNVLAACRRAGGPRAIQCRDLELRHGASRSEGLVMIKTNSDQWSTVCANGIGFKEAAAVCRSIGSLNPGLAMPVMGVYKPNNTTEENITQIENFTCSPGAFIDSCTFDTPGKITEDCLHPRNRFGVMCPDVAPTPRPMPSPTLKCFRQSASICFADESLNSPSDDVELAGDCNATLEYVAGQACLVVVNYTNCANKTNNNAIYVEYLLEVKFKGENATNGNTNMRPPLDFHLYCTVVNEALATAATFRPDRVTATTFKDKFPDGAAVIELYRELINGIPGKPVDTSVQVGTIIYAVVILRASPQSWLVVKNCSAQDGTETVHLVKDKCSQSNVLLLPINDTMIAVRFQAFTMSGGSGTVSIMCATIICRLGDPSAECSRACRSTFRGASSRSSSSSGGNQPQNHMTRPAWLTVVPEGYGKSAEKPSQPMASLLLGSLALLVASLPKILDK